MAEFRNTRDDGGVPNISDETVSKVGLAVRQIALIREAYREGLADLDGENEKQELAQQAEAAAVKAISEQGLSVMEYNRVVATADNDAELEQRLLAVAQAG